MLPLAGGVQVKTCPLRFGCHNIRGFHQNLLFVQSLLCDLDILAISKHWLHTPEFSHLSCLSSEFCYDAKSHTPLDDVLSNHYSRGSGGVALVWRKSLDFLVFRLDVDSDRILGIQFQAAC